MKNKLDYLSSEKFGCLKGIFAIFILLHHVYQFSGILSGTSVGFIFLNLGYWAVGMFMFMSGFGLYESYSKKGMDYIKSFPRNRLLTFEITYVIVAVVYIIYDLIMKVSHTGLEYLQTFTYGSTIISFGWYLQLNLVLYIFFWAVFRFVSKSKKKLVEEAGCVDKSRSLVLGILLVLFVAVNILFGMDDARYTPVVYFAVGIIWSIHKERIEAIFSKAWGLVMVVSLLVFFGGYLMLWRYTFGSYSAAAIRSISGIALIFFVMTFVRLEVRHFPIIVSNPITWFLGRISLEIYVCQGIVLRTMKLFIENKYIYALVSMALTIILAIPLEMLFRRLGKLVRRERTNS